MRAGATRVYNWALQKAESEKSPLWIGLLFFLEIVLFIPLDVLLMFFCLQNRKKTLSYVGIAAVASTISGLIGYILGLCLWDLVGPFIVPHLIAVETFEKMAHHFQLYENGAVFLGALLPFPLKVLTIGAGVFELEFLPFVICFLSARILRFLVIGATMLLWGEKVKEFVEKNFHRIVLAIGAKLAIALLLLWILA